jgi:large subunit ribosomal protein L27
MAHTKAGGSTALGRDSQSKRLGVKLFAGQPAKAGMVIVRQRGTRFFPGEGVKKGGDDTLFATRAGTVQFIKKWRRAYTGKLKLAKVVSVVSQKQPKP